MRGRRRIAFFLCLFACAGCGKKSTDQLIADLKSSSERERLVAVRLLPQRKADAEKIAPALIDALEDSEGDIRWSAAIGLGYFGEQAKEAIPALQAALKDHDARVREAAGVALGRIDPNLASEGVPPKTKGVAKTNSAKSGKK